MKRYIDVKEIQDITTDMLRYVNIAAGKAHINYYLVAGSAIGAMRHNGPIPWDYDVDLGVMIEQLEPLCRAIADELSGTNYYITTPGDLTDPNNITLFPRIGIKGANIRELHVDLFPFIDSPNDDHEIKDFFDELASLRDQYGKKVVVNTTNGKLWKRIGKKVYSIIVPNKTNEQEVLQKYNNLRIKYIGMDTDYCIAPYGAYGYKNIIRKELFGTPVYVPYRDLLLPVPEKTEEFLEHFYGDWRKYPAEDSIKKQYAYKVKVDF